MKFSECWLREWTNPKISTEELAEQITMSGFEVNNITPVAWDFENIIIGRLISYKKNFKYENAYDVCVDIGKKKLLNITSKFQYFYVGMRVIVAETCSLLSEKNYKVRKYKFFNKNSDGILFSLSELGIIYDKSKEPINLPDDAPIGKDIRDYLQLNDNIIDINITHNRPDCLSILGIAREISAQNYINFSIPKIRSIRSTITDKFPIYVQKPEFCPNYFCRIIKGITTNVNTPIWIKEKLRRCGIISRNIIIDIINYILIEIGQPIHIFNKDEIDGSITIRLSHDNESITLCNGKKIALSLDTLIISDQSKALDLAGITNDNINQINSKTKNIFLGCFYFHPSMVSRKSNQYKLFTEISHRYEKGIDFRMQFFAIEYATKLIIEICGGHIGPIVRKTSIRYLKVPYNILLRRKTLNRIVGYTISNKIVASTLCRLGFHVNSIRNTWEITVPTWRFDINSEEDIIEEILRIYGYNDISSLSINSNFGRRKKISSCNEENSLLNQIKNILVYKGYQEIITYSFVNPALQKLLYPNINPIILSNPFSKEMSVMRLSLWTGLLKTVVYNKRRQQKRIRLFEYGMCFSIDKKFKLGIRQDNMLSGIVYGLRSNANWNSSTDLVDFYDLKGDIETIFESIGQTENISFKKKNHPSLHPGQSSAIYLKNKIIGFIGMIRPDIEKYLNLDYHAIVFEIFWKNIYKINNKQIRDIPKFPINFRDISIMVPINISYSDIISVCKKVILENQFIEISVIDVYQGNNIRDGYKSITINLAIQGILRTLHEKEISNTIQEYVNNLKKHFHVILR